MIRGLAGRAAQTQTMGNARRVLAYGDSLTAGYHRGGLAFHPYADRLSAKLACKVVHVGLSGWTVEAMLQHLEYPVCSDVCDRPGPGLRFELKRAIEEGEPYTHVALLAGTNDMCRSTPETLIRNLSQMHQVVWDAGAHSLALTVPGMAAERTMRQVTQYRRAVNDSLRQLVADSAGKAALVDIHAAVPHLELSEAERGQLWERDGLHMTPAGYDLIADAVAFVLMNDKVE